MSLRKLTSTNAFVVTDLDDVPAAGIVRSAPKILQGGAKDLARSLTYTFATFGVQRCGASAGINATPDERHDAITAFVAEVGDDVANGTLALDAGKGVTDAALEPLTATDGRSAARFTMVGDDTLRTHLAGLGPAVAADAAVGLDGKTVAIEGFGEAGPALVDAIEARGGRVIALSTTSGALLEGDLDAASLRAQWADAGPAMTGDTEPAWKVFQSGADVLFTGSKMGAVNHTTAEKISPQALIAHAPIPYTARALAILGRAGTTVLPDFIPVAGPIFADWPIGDSTPEAIVADATSAITDAVNETAGASDGAFLAACARAESFLASWTDERLFGRPLAS